MLVLGVGVLLHLLTLTPATASLIYCIGEDGHSGIETVGGGERDCESCCQEEPTEMETSGSGQSRECTDVSLSPTDSVLRAASDLHPDLAPSPALSVPPTRASFAAFAPMHSGNRLAPPRASPQRMRRDTVLRI